MAQLTDQLSVITRGPETIQPVRPAPSFFEALSTFGSNAIQAVQAGEQVTARREAARRQAAEDAREAQERTAANAAAVGGAWVLTGDQTVEASNAAAELARELTPAQRAISQGRTTTQAVEMRSEAAIRALLRRFPDQAAVVMDTLRENGVLTPLTRRYERAARAVEQEQDNAIKLEQDLVEFGTTQMGLDFNNRTPEVRTQLLESVRQYRASLSALDLQQRRLGMLQTEGAINQQQRTEVERVVGQNSTTQMMNAISSLVFPAMESLTNYINDPSINDAVKDQEITRTLQLLETRGAQVLSNLRAQYGAQMTAEQWRMVEEHYNTQIGSIRQFIDGPNSLRQTNQRQLGILQDTLGIQMHRAMPLWSQLRTALGGNSTVIDTLLQTVGQNPQLQQALTREFSEMGNLSPGEDRVILNNLINIVGRGNFDVANLSAEEAYRTSPAVMQYAENAVIQAAVQNGTDVDGNASALRAIGAASNVAIEANKQWGERDLTRDLRRFLDRRIWNTIAVGGQRANREQAVTTANAYMPAVQNMYLALRDSPTNDPYYRLVWNNNNHNEGMRVVAGAGWRVERNRVPYNGQGVGSLGAADPRIPAELRGQQTNPPFSRDILDRVSVLNGAVERLSRMGQQSWDPQMPQGVNEIERRRYYGLGEVPAAMRQQQQQERQRGNNRQNMSQIVEGLLNQINEAEFTPGEMQPVPYADSVVATENNTGNPAQRNLAGDSTAMGDGQFVEGTWLGLIRSRRPDLAAGKSESEILALRADPQLSREMIVAYAEENRREMSEDYGYRGPFGPREAHTAHFLGPRDAARVLMASPDTPITSVVSARSIAANRSIFDRYTTVGTFMSGYIGGRLRRGSNTRSAR